MLGKLTWAAIPIDQPIPMVAAGSWWLVILGVLVWVALKGLDPLSVARVDHQRRPQAHRRDVRLPRRW